MKGIIVTVLSSIEDKKVGKGVGISNYMLKKVVITILGCKNVRILTNVVQTAGEYKELKREEYIRVSKEMNISLTKKLTPK